MFEQFKIYRNTIIGLVVGVLFVAVYIYISSLKNQIQDLNNDIKSMQVELANSKLEANRYKTALDNQNEKIDSLGVDKKKVMEKLSKWKNQKPIIKYKVIEKIREVKSNDCKDIKSTIDAIRAIDYNSL